MKIYFSPSLCGFFNDDLHGPRVSLGPDPAWVRPEGDEEASAPMIEIVNNETGIPDDAIEISLERHAELFAGQAAGQQIVAGEGGLPINVDRPKMSDEDAMANLRIMRTRKLTETDGIVARHRDEKDQGIATTLLDGEFKKLLADRQALRDLPATTKDAFADYSALMFSDAPKT